MNYAKNSKLIWVQNCKFPEKKIYLTILCCILYSTDIIYNRIDIIIVVLWLMIPNNSIDTQISPFWFSGTTTLDHLPGSLIVHGLNINKGLEVLQHYIGLGWTGCMRCLKETARFASIFQTVVELGTTPSITSSTSAILLPITNWASVVMPGILEAM